MIIESVVKAGPGDRSVGSKSRPIDRLTLHGDSFERDRGRLYTDTLIDLLHHGEAKWPSSSVPLARRSHLLYSPTGTLLCRCSSTIDLKLTCSFFDVHARAHVSVCTAIIGHSLLRRIANMTRCV